MPTIKEQKEKYKRETRLIRISTDNHKLLKWKSTDKGKTMSKLTDEIFTDYFKPKESLEEQ
ncbi:MAG: hypothetical protein A2431_00300 [Candidatus Zambryskibacteria bacterium RIFOXYC1_FULL_39_10]|uniref:Uncharacterized protein n=1 Tax=Candidatus Zambryskibacteria bacterium RIFOXYC1_FULL_39_10 TaxID=1802779 RepID=A0A1G2UZI4_9BACT|nr:MAG: hypothetical protein A2431_00300 [Candidatus Zambryskibacteria bacterium RIFOXYC1_FULL_39_10]OHB15987.1 MAG: hypothetical protein A2605_03840 [Candidatus Zambryskibacteria bacterium RIFOXYD1_FULL_39_35]